MFSHKLPHEVAEVGNTSEWHGVVHRNSNALVEGMTLDLNDVLLLGLLNEEGFEIGVFPLDSEDDVNVTSISLVGDLGLVVSLALVNKVPKHLTSLLGKKGVVFETSVLVHV